MTTVLALALIGAGGLLARWTWFGLVPAIAGAVIVPMHYALAALALAAVFVVAGFTSRN